GDPKSYGGRVARVSPAIDQSDRTLKVEAEVPNQDGALRAGSFVGAEIVTAAGIEKVLTVEAGKTTEVRVRTGRKTGDRVEIVEGLSGGEMVVVTPGNLTGGQAVTVQGAGRTAGR